MSRRSITFAAKQKLQGVYLDFVDKLGEKAKLGDVDAHRELQEMARAHKPRKARPARQVVPIDQSQVV